MKSDLYDKIQSLKSLEKLIDGESSKFNEDVIQIYIQGLKDIREYYCEILI